MFVVTTLIIIFFAYALLNAVIGDYKKNGIIIKDNDYGMYLFIKVLCVIAVIGGIAQLFYHHQSLKNDIDTYDIFSNIYMFSLNLFTIIVCGVSIFYMIRLFINIFIKIHKYIMFEPLPNQYPTRGVRIVKLITGILLVAGMLAFGAGFLMDTGTEQKLRVANCVSFSGIGCVAFILLIWIYIDNIRKCDNCRKRKFTRKLVKIADGKNDFVSTCVNCGHEYHKIYNVPTSKEQASYDKIVNKISTQASFGSSGKNRKTGGGGRSGGGGSSRGF